MRAKAFLSVAAGTFCLILSGIGFAATDADDLYYPFIIVGEGTWETEIGVINMGGRQATGTLKPYAGNGSSVSSSLAIDLPAHGSMEIKVGETFDEAEAIAYMVLEATSGHVEGYTRIYSPGSGRAAFPAVSRINSGDLYLPHVESSENTWTGIALVNATSETKDVEIHFNTGQVMDLTFGAMEQKVFTIAGLFGGESQPNPTSGVIINGSEIVGVELFGGREDADGTCLAGIALGDETGTELYFPHFETGGGWQTGAVLFNFSHGANTIYTTHYSAAGVMLGAQETTLDGTQSYMGMAGDLDLPEGTAWFKAGASEPMTGFGLYGDRSAGQLAGYTGAGAVGKEGVFVKPGHGDWTAIVLINTENVPVFLNFLAYGDSGNSIAGSNLCLAAHQIHVALAEDLFEEEIENATHLAYSATRDVAGFQVNASGDMLEGLPGIKGAEKRFGVHPSSANDYAYAKDLGIDVNREGVYFIWNWVDIGKNGTFSFKNATAPEAPDKPGSGGPMNYDREREDLLNVTDMIMINNVCPFRGASIANDEFQNQKEKEIYQDFVEKMVERYDGDADLGCTRANGVDCYAAGDKEYPSPFLIEILKKNPIRYWQVCNQVTDVCAGPDCSVNDLYAEKYAEVMELTHAGVKAACPGCQVLIAGDSSAHQYPPVYERLGGNHVDIIDKHFFGEADGYDLIQGELNMLKASLKASGFEMDLLRFWVTETGTYSGDPVEDAVDPPKPGPPFQSEVQQARGLVKRYAVFFGNGVEKVLWAWGVKEGFGCDCCIFDYTGLVYDGNLPAQECDQNKYDRGDGVKKLAYFSYKLMTEKLKGFTSVETIRSSEQTHVYKFTKNNSLVYVGWSENGESAALADISSDFVRITKAVPGVEFGELVTNFDTAFDIETKSVQNGNVTIQLDETPVFIETL